MFKKLELSIADLNLDELKGPLDCDYGHGPFKEYKIKNYEYLFNNIKNCVKFSIEPTEINITGISHPGSLAHKDHWPVVLNYYFNPNNDITYWWEQVKNHIPDNPCGATNYMFDNLIKTGSFMSKKNDTYLLNTKVIHSVHVRAISETRYILKFAWEHGTFNEILNSIKPL